LKYLVLLAVLLFGSDAVAQTVISGNLKNELNAVVENANVIIYEKKSDDIVAYSVSDEKGNFSLLFNSNADSLKLEVSLVGYEKVAVFLANKKGQTINLILKSAINLLPDVIIKEEAIQVKGDTISYNARSFSDKSDRVIIDVIRKLPGIKVTETGQILFNNKAINKFYIEGKDLLENRYSIASNNLPADAVDQIQLLQDHQPIALLNGIEQSDRAAINIKLNRKSKMRMLGNGSAGLGLSPFATDNNLTLLKFAKGVQFINSLKYNNAGFNLDDEITEQNFSPNLYSSGSVKQDLISLVKAGVPPIDQSRYWFNNNALATGNYLIGLNKTFDLKFGGAFERDRIRDITYAQTRVYLPNDTIVIDEGHSGLNIYSKLLTDLTVEANTQKIYLKDALKFQRIWGSANDHITTINVQQNVRNPFINLINDLSGLIKLGTTLVGISSCSSYSDLPQRLTVEPGQYANVLNGGRSFDQLSEKIQLKGFFTDNSATFTKKAGNVTISNKLGGLAHFQTLSNDLTILEDGVERRPDGNFFNELERMRIKIYDEINGNLSTSGFNFSAGLRTSFNTLNNGKPDAKQQVTGLFFNPSFNVLYKFNAFWESSISGVTSNTISFDSNPSFILQNYRSLVSNDIPAKRVSGKSLTYRLGYKNIINAVYSNFDVNYSYNRSNILISTTFDGILTTRKALVQDNPYWNIGSGWNINKYYLSLKTSFDLYLKYNRGKSRQLQQGTLIDFSSDTYVAGTKINTKIGKNIAIEHSLDLTIDKISGVSLTERVIYPGSNTLKQTLMMKCFFSNEFQTRINMEQYYNKGGVSKGQNHYFADLTVLKSITKPKLDFSVTLSNIFNVRSYSNYLNDGNILIKSDYLLRDRTLMFRAGYQF
jgi:hypothetical protein